MDARANKLWQRGLGHFRQGNLEAAQAHFEAFLARVPGSGPGSFRLSLVHARRGRHQAAAELARAAQAAEPGSAEVLAHLARCELAVGEAEAARAAALRAVALPRTNAVVLDALAVVLTRLDEAALAQELFDQALALDPAQPSIHYNRALARRQADQPEAAEEDLQACLALNPAHSRAWWALARLREPARHLPRLLGQPLPAAPAEREYLALARARALEDAGRMDEAADALRLGMAARAGRPPVPTPDWAERIAEAFDERAVLPGAGLRAAATATPVFVVGMPRSGVSLFGGLLARHPRVHDLGQLPVFSRHLARHLGSDDPLPPTPEALARARALDLPALGAEVLAATRAGGGKPLLLCESRPMNFALVGLIARTFPGARFVHLARDPLDTCVSLLAHAAGDAGPPGHDEAALADYYLQYDRLMRHWQRLLPGRILDLDYESLVAKPEMVLRVACAFLGIRYGASLRMGLQLHARSLGRGRRWAPYLPTLEAGLQPLRRAARSA